MTSASMFTSRRLPSSRDWFLPCLAVLSFLSQPAMAEVVPADAAGLAGKRKAVATTGDVGPALALCNQFATRTRPRVGDSVQPCRAIESVPGRIGGSTSLLAAGEVSAAFRRSLVGEFWRESRIALDARSAIESWTAIESRTAIESWTQPSADTGSSSAAIPSKMVFAVLGTPTILE